MTGSMVERVALALVRADAKSSQADHPDLSYDDVYALAYMLFETHHVPLARAAIEAMRDPTEAMRSAVALKDWTGSNDMDWQDGWRVMIDAALTPEA